MQALKILNFGSLNIDYTYQVDHFVQAGETVSSRERRIFPGGKGLNQSIALARAGAPVYHAGAIGAQDGGFLRDLLHEAGANVEHIEKNDATASGHAIIQLDDSGQNCILLYGGTNQSITKERADEVLAGFSEGDFLLLQNEINQMPYIIEKAHEKKMRIVLNPSPMDEKIATMPLEYVEYFILNEVEASALCGDVPTEKIVFALAEKYPEAKIVLTLGSAGSYYHFGEDTHYQPIYSVPVVDTTGAGDTFTGYFLACLMNGQPIPGALRWAAAASAIAVSREGAAPSIPSMDEVRNALPSMKEKRA